MKQRLIFLFLILTGFAFGQNSTLTCFRNQVIDKRLICDPCPNQDELFSGVKITTNGRNQNIYAPFKVKIYSDRYFELLDAYGNFKRLDMIKVPAYNTKTKMVEFLSTCLIDSVGSGGGITLDTNYVHKDSNEYIRGTKIFQPVGANNWIIVDSTLTFLGLDGPSILHIEKNELTIDRITTPSGGNQVLVRQEIADMIHDSIPEGLDTTNFVRISGSQSITGAKNFTNPAGDSLKINRGFEYHNKDNDPSSYFGLNEQDGYYSRNSSFGAEAYMKPGRMEIIRGSYVPNGTTDAYNGSETQALIADSLGAIRDTATAHSAAIAARLTTSQANTLIADSLVAIKDSLGVHRTAINGKQSTLVSGTNLKTINGNSLLGSGDLTISGGGSSYAWGRTDYASGGSGSTITYTGPAWTGTGTNTGATTVSANSTYYAYGYASNLFENASATTSQVAGFRQSSNTIHRGQYGGGGFEITIRFSLISSINIGINKRCFVGLNGATNAAPTDVNPSSKTNILGIGWDATDATIQIFHNDGSGTATRVNTSIDIPDEGIMDVFVVTLYSEPGSSSVTITADRIHDGAASYSTTVSTDIPSTSTIMYIDGYASAGGTSDSAGMRFVNAVIKTR